MRHLRKNILRSRGNGHVNIFVDGRSAYRLNRALALRVNLAALDSRIDPLPFTPEEFAAGGTLIDEIKSTGKEIM